MAQDLATLSIRVDNSDSIRAEASLGKLAVTSGKTEAATQRLTRRFALMEIEARQMDAAMSKASSATARIGATMDKVGAAVFNVRNAFGLLAGSLALREWAKLSDTYANLTARLSLVTTGSENLAAVQARLFDQAQRTRTSVESTAELYTRLARNAGTLGASQEDLLRVTETISKAMVVSGASAASADAALVQLGQAFASGVLRGEELNSILEQSPRLAEAIAKGMGVTVGELRKLGQEGKLTGEAVFNAIKSQGQAIDDEFGRMPKTIAGAMQQVQNEILKAVGTTGGSEGIIGAIESIGKAVGPVARTVNAFFGGIAIAAAEAALGFERANQKRGEQMQAFARFLAPEGEKRGLAKWFEEEGTRRTKDADDFIRLLEKQVRDTEAKIVGAVQGGEVSTTAPKRTGRTSPVDPNAAKDLEAIQKATDAYYNALNQRQIDAINAATNSRQQNDELRALIQAYGEGEAAVDRHTIAQAGNNAVRELGAGVSDKLVASVRREAEEHARLAIELGKVQDAQADRARQAQQAADEAQRAADQAQREAERRAEDLHRMISGTVEGIFTDIANRRNPFVAVIENLKRAAIHALAEAFTEKVEGKIADILGIKGPASKQETAAKVMNAAADKQLRAANAMNSGAGGLVGTTDAPSTSLEAWKRAMGIAGAAYGGYQAGAGIGAATQSQTKGAIGGAVTGAATGAAAGGLPGAIVGAFAGVVGGFTGARDAAREAERALLAMGVEAHKAAASFHLSIVGDSLDQELGALRSQYVALIKQLLEANGGKYPANFPRTAQPRGNVADDFTQAAEDYNKAVKRATERYTQGLTDQYDDFHANYLEATGQKGAAEVYRREAERESARKKLVESFGETIDATEQRVLNEFDRWQEALKKAGGALNAFTTSVRNAPTGFKLEGYIQEFAKGRPYPGQFQVPTSPLIPPMSPLSPSSPQLSRTGTVGATAPITITGGINITVQEAKTPTITADAVTAAFLHKLDQHVAASQGLSGQRSKGLNTMPSPGRVRMPML